MLQLVQNNRTGAIDVLEIPVPTTLPGHVLVRNAHSVVSVGTEQAGLEFAKSSLLGKARARPDLVKKVVAQVKNDGLIETYKMVKTRLDEPHPLGYSSAGVVVAVGDGVDYVAPGDTVACAGFGYASHAGYVLVPVNLVAKARQGVPTESAAFSTLGAIALQGIRRLDLTPGESVGVIGLGLIGQITVQLLKAYGHPVVGLDVSERRVAESNAHGLDAGTTIDDTNRASIGNELSNGYGLDAVLITASTKEHGPVELAGQILRERGRVSVVGDVGMDIPRRVFYPKELDFRISRSYGPGRYDSSYEEYGLDYPLPWVRWTEQRNMEEYLRLVSSNLINPAALITHRFPIESGTDAYSLVNDANSARDFLGVVIEYGTSNIDQSGSVAVSKTCSRNQANTQEVIASLVGAGKFMSGTIVPALQKLPKVKFASVASARGLSAVELSKKIRADQATTDTDSLITDSETNLIVAATTHDQNSDIAAKALSAGKAVHVEKPLAIDLDGLRRVNSSFQTSGAILNVGFNRRFSKHTEKLKNIFSGSSTPLNMIYRINAGFIEKDNWVHDPVIGGGRIIGEVCHFVDLMQHICGSKPVAVKASRLPSNGGTVLSDDNATAIIEFENGALGTVIYSALGAPGQPKEQLQIMGGGNSAELDDFKQLTVWSSTGKSRQKGKQDKGHAQMFRHLVSSVLNDENPPIPYEELMASSLATLAIEMSLRTGSTISVDHQNLELKARDE